MNRPVNRSWGDQLDWLRAHEKPQPKPWRSWSEYIEDGPITLEQLEQAFAEAYRRGGEPETRI